MWRVLLCPVTAAIVWDCQNGPPTVLYCAACFITTNFPHKYSVYTTVCFFFLPLIFWWSNLSLSWSILYTKMNEARRVENKMWKVKYIWYVFTDAEQVVLSSIITVGLQDMYFWCQLKTIYFHLTWFQFTLNWHAVGTVENVKRNYILHNNDGSFTLTYSQFFVDLKKAFGMVGIFKKRIWTHWLESVLNAIKDHVTQFMLERLVQTFLPQDINAEKIL